MAKVFMSILGTSPYVEVVYKFGEKCSIFSPFVQEAYLSLTRREWGKKDRLIFFLTDKAQSKNWNDHGNFPEGLYSRLKKLSLPSKIITVPFREGHSEDEIMENFLAILSQIEERDEVVFDITHSFRSLPMLNLVALSYAKVLKKIKIKRIHYGAFEVLGMPTLVKEMPVDERIAPVFDLTPYVMLLDWTFAVDEFSRYGMAERLEELVKAKAIPILKETKGRDEQAKDLRNFIEYLQGLAMNIYTSRCREIIERNWESLTLKDIDLQSLLPPFVPLIAKVEQKVAGFINEDSWLKAKAAVAWCVEHNFTQQGYTILEESIITEMVKIMRLSVINNRNNRKFVSDLLSVTGQGKPPEKWKGILLDRRQDALKWVKKGGKTFKDLGKTFSKIVILRNDINHCGFNNDPSKSEKLMKELKGCYEETVSLMNEIREVLNS